MLEHMNTEPTRQDIVKLYFYYVLLLSKEYTRKCTNII